MYFYAMKLLKLAKWWILAFSKVANSDSGEKENANHINIPAY
jgi:hypothetical protein